MVERTADQRIRTTEWEDIQYKHGNCVGKYRDQELEIMLQKLKDENPNLGLEAYDPEAERATDKAERAGFDVDPNKQQALLDGEEDEDGPSLVDDDDDVLAAFRAKRKAQLQADQVSNVFGSVVRIASADYVAQITDASANGRWVVACLAAKGVEDCDALIAVLQDLAPKHRDVKFVVADVQECVPKFPRKETPYVLYYKDKKALSHTVGLASWGGKRLSVQSAEWCLKQQGVLPKDDDDEPEDSTAKSKYYQKMEMS